MKLVIVMPPTASMPLVSGGGVERLCELFIRENDSSADPFDITVISRFDEQSETIKNKYSHARFLYVRIPRSEPPSNQLMSRLTGIERRHDYLSGVVKLLKNVEFDRMVLENCPELAPTLARRFHTKPVLHAHSRFFGSDRKGWYKSVKHIGRFVFVSEFLKNAAVKCGVSEDKCSVVRNCVDTAEFDRSRFEDIRQSKRRQYSLDEGDILAVFIGRLTPEKGALELVKAVSHSEYTSSRLKLLIIGSAQYGINVHDDYRTELEVAAAKNRVIFIGSVKSASAARFLARADMAVIPSIFDEPAGLSVLEALSSGLPIIVTDSGGIPEYTEGPDDGVVTTVKRGIGFVGSLTKAIDTLAERLHDNPDAAVKLSEAARSHAKKFGVSQYYANLRRMME